MIDNSTENLTGRLSAETEAQRRKIDQGLRELGREKVTGKKGLSLVEAQKAVVLAGRLEELLQPRADKQVKFREHLEAIKELLFGQFKPFICEPPAEDYLTHEKFLELYPEIDKATFDALPEEKKQLINFRDDIWYRSPSTHNLHYPAGSTMADVWEKTLNHEVAWLQNHCELLVSEIIPCPGRVMSGDIVGDDYYYGSVLGQARNLDPIGKLIRENGSIGFTRFNNSYDRVQNSVLPEVRKKIESYWKVKGLSIPAFTLMMTPVLVHRWLFDKHPELSLSRVSEMTSTPVVDFNGTNTPMNARVGGKDFGGAGMIYTNNDLNIRSDMTGFRITLAFLKD